ncbi:MAG: hypothetical protein ACOYXR_06750 [Nitrospirota bacterium]
MNLRTSMGIGAWTVAVWLGGAGLVLAESTSAPSADATPTPPTVEAAPSGILIELFLAPEQREAIPVIKKEFEALSITRVRPQVFRLGNPPRNIAIGKDIPADVARLALQIAVDYNRGVESLLPEYRYFPKHIVIGSSAFDEASQIPIKPDDLQRLRDPSLSTDQFHELYRSLTGEDNRLPTYLK